MFLVIPAVTNVSIPSYRHAISLQPLQPVYMNGSIYPIHFPKENNVKDMFAMSASQTNVTPCNLPKCKDKTRRNSHQEGLQNIEIMNEEFGEKPAQTNKVNKDSRHACWHFLRGYCERGDSCGFKHQFTDADFNAQKVFLSGLPTDITEVSLRKQLSDLGCNLVTKLLGLHKN